MDKMQICNNTVLIIKHKNEVKNKITAELNT